MRSVGGSVDVSNVGTKVVILLKKFCEHKILSFAQSCNKNEIIIYRRCFFIVILKIWK